VPPGPQLVLELVNSRDVESGSDDLAEPAAVGRWLTEKRLVTGDVHVRPADRDRLVTLREALRALLLANHDRIGDPESLAEVNRLAAAVPLVVALEGPGAGRLDPVGRGVDAAIGRVVGAVYSSMADGTWARLKACRSDTCQWGFYDYSRNQSRNWCAMAVCGNRAKARAYRRREHDR